MNMCFWSLEFLFVIIKGEFTLLPSQSFVETIQSPFHQILLMEKRVEVGISLL